jgi:spermidine synthase
MGVRPIIGPSDPRLLRNCAPVTTIDEQVRKVVRDLHDTLSATTGVGLAAPQIGVNMQVCIYDAGRDGTPLNAKTLINPVVHRCWGEQQLNGEGCKSVPGVRVTTRRYEGIEVAAINEHGEEIEITAEGYEAIVLQHEIDHLNGRLLTGKAASDYPQGFELSSWQEANLAQIALRLQPATEAPEGVLKRQSRTGYDLLTVKDGTQIQLYFTAGGASPHVSGIMSRVDIARPLYLLGRYTQVMIAALLWVPEAERIYHIGFGGGRIPMVLHHYFPNLVIESTELDREVVRIARQWFGIEQDERMKVYVEEGRSYLSRQPSTVTYDAILVDCFTGSGQHPYSLSTREFYELTLQHLTPGGVVATNLAISDPLFDEKWRTMQACFRHVWRYETDAATVFFGSDSEITAEELQRRAHQIVAKAPLGFPFVELLADFGELPPAQPSTDLLTDEASLAATADDLMFIGVPRNAPCPCGSGKKFKNCHGR